MQKVDRPTSLTKLNENCGLPDLFTDYQIRHLGNPSGLPEILLKIDPCHIWSKSTTSEQKITNYFITRTKARCNGRNVGGSQKMCTKGGVTGFETINYSIILLSIQNLNVDDFHVSVASNTYIIFKNIITYLSCLTCILSMFDEQNPPKTWPICDIVTNAIKSALQRRTKL